MHPASSPSRAVSDIVVITSAWTQRVIRSRTHGNTRASLDSMARDWHGAARLRGGRARMHNLTMFDWSDLRYLLAVAREGSSLAAARALRVNQSTVHRRLVEL